MQFSRLFDLRARMTLLCSLVLLVLLPGPLFARTVVFWQEGFPFVDTAPIDRATLTRALEGFDPDFADMAMIKDPAALAHADLLVLPYGSAVPVDAWKSMTQYLGSGGHLLILGGEPLHVPVTGSGGKFIAERGQDTYARFFDFKHAYEVPVGPDARFRWRTGYPLQPIANLSARRFFAVEGSLDGLGYMDDSEGEHVAAPVIYTDHGLNGGRAVMLDFDPVPGFWQSEDGVRLIHQAAAFARKGSVHLSIETLFSTLRPGEPPLITAHLSSLHRGDSGKPAGELSVTLSSEKQLLDSARIPVAQNGSADIELPFHQALAAGFYTIAATYSEDGEFRARHENGFFVADADQVRHGPLLGVKGDFLTRDGAPYFPVGSNYFSTESDGWDFSAPRNALVCDRDFAEMARHGVTLVRTGVWIPNRRFIEASANNGANERFLRNVEGFLLCAQRHNVAVNFTFFAFSPHSGGGPWPDDPAAAPANPYLAPGAVYMEQAYVKSVVERFKGVPWLSWDLINEPSFSNPRVIFRGNSPLNDPAEVAAWRKWLRQRYDGKLGDLARAWTQPEEQLGSFDAVDLPAPADMTYSRADNPRQVRAVDYNLFAQDMFSNWVRSMVGVIRATGSRQLIDVGQDEGGVTDRVLNQFYGGAGVSFTTNHTYWQDDALLWDSIAAKRPGVPNITGETGYQPVHTADGSWRYDELSALGLTERKWALGFAGGSSGVLQWSWDKSPDFGMLRSDGSEKLWVNMMREMGAFARQAAPFATALENPDVALVLPQSFQMSTGHDEAIESQQKAVRALYGYARSAAYAVGEYQMDTMQSAKLILVPSPQGLTESAWQALETRVKNGAVLLVTGPFDADEHLHATERASSLGLPYSLAPLTLRHDEFHFPGGDEELIFSGMKTTVLSQAVFPGGASWEETALGKGKILFASLPLELNDNLQAIGDVYRYALKVAGVAPIYTTAMNDPGILICPTRFPNATLYVITSESNRKAVSFDDARSGKHIAGELENGRAAMLLIGAEGKILAAYHWQAK